jgi:hypothetical protein
MSEIQIWESLVGEEKLNYETRFFKRNLIERVSIKKY